MRKEYFKERATEPKRRGLHHSSPIYNPKEYFARNVPGEANAEAQASASLVSRRLLQILSRLPLKKQLLFILKNFPLPPSIQAMKRLAQDIGFNPKDVNAYAKNYGIFLRSQGGLRKELTQNDLLKRIPFNLNEDTSANAKDCFLRSQELLRKELTQNDLGIILGVTRQTINAWENDLPKIEDFTNHTEQDAAGETALGA